MRIGLKYVRCHASIAPNYYLHISCYADTTNIVAGHRRFADFQH